MSKKSDSTSSSGDDKDHKKPSKPIKNKKKVTSKDTLKKTLVEGDHFKDFKKRQKNLVLNILIIPNEKIINSSRIQRQKDSLWFNQV